MIIAREMLHSGNWLMPILHGEPYLAKPPMMNWLIAASSSLFGELNEWTGRLPSVLLMLFTGISVYFLTGRWLKREGRLFAAIMTLSMLGIIKKGRAAEIEALNIFVISSVLLVWINGYISRWKPVALWGVALSLVGVGFLSKGPQVFLFFYMTILAYLLLRKQISFFFSKGHGLGLALLLLILAAYSAVILQWTTVDHYIQSWIGEGITKAEAEHSLSFLTHLIEYPLEGIGSFMPCLMFLIPLLLYRDVRQGARAVFTNEAFVFSLIVIGANFPLYWLLPNARFRHFLPAGPFVAIAVAVVFEYYLTKMETFSGLKIFFRRFLKISAILTVLSAAAAAAVIIIRDITFSYTVFFMLAGIVFLGILVLGRSHSPGTTLISVYVPVVTALIFLIHSYIEVQYESRRENYPRNIAQEINLVLPDDAEIVYELGYRRFLAVTCYINREVRQINKFAELKRLNHGKGKICFIFDTRFLNSSSERDRNILLNEIRWKKIYSRYFKGSRGDIIMGTL
ncbi:MAG: glycosyltransferase family 39 protein [Nitrospirota bacterium]